MKSSGLLSVGPNKGQLVLNNEIKQDDGGHAAVRVGAGEMLMKGYQVSIRQGE
jgi:hypothetical protein